MLPSFLSFIQIHWKGILRMASRMTLMRRQEERAGYAFLLPSLIGTIVFIVIPIFMSLILGFTEWNPMRGLSGMEFVGLDNYIELLHDDRVLAAVRNNLVYSFTYVPFTICIALFIASLLNRFTYFKVPLRMMVFMPYVSSLVSVATVWMVLLYPDMGPINSILHNVFGIENPPTWFISSKWALPGIIMMSVWHDVGYYMIILLANMQALPRDVYESAEIDGANAWKTFFHITVPMLRPSLFFCITLATINSFKVFDQINIITKGGPGFSTTVLVQSSYYYAFQEFRISYASAVALLLFVVIFFFSFVLQKIEKKLAY